MSNKYITVTNARQNNLQNISLKIPKNKITVFTGVSGSGKSSLVFETIGAEAQRQINETQSSFIRHRLQHLGVADVDKINNLNVPVIINQKRLGGNPRSTVGTVTDIYSALRLLYARMGSPFVGYSNIFSFNHPQGMCLECEGLGFIRSVDIDKLLDRSKSLNEGAIHFATFQPGGWRLTRYTMSGYFDNDKKLQDYTADEWQMLLYAAEHKPKNPTDEWGKTVNYSGLIPRIEKTFLSGQSTITAKLKQELERITTAHICPSCQGKRLNEKILSCKINGNDIAECTALSVDELLTFISGLKSAKFQTVIDELSKKLQHLMAIGLQYLNLDRQTNSLSGGESQRIKMVKNLGSSLVDLLYIFDEPSIGLHPKDLANIAKIIKQIRDKGNTVLIVEHDPYLIEMADWVVDMGPGSGKFGGQIVYQGSVAKLKQSVGKTGQYFARKPTYNQQPRAHQDYLHINNASLYNLQNVSVTIPKGVMTVVSGVAGSGKSTLINRILPQIYPDITVIDQTAIFASSRSNLLTYLNLFDKVRKLLANANQVSEKLFSSNSSSGGCKNCKGLGVEKIDLAFMDTVEQSCEVCHGSGFAAEVLPYTYQGKNIVDILSMTVAEAAQFFTGKEFEHAFNLLIKLGLDYLTLGQRLSSFSGGERQRLKLSKELSAYNKIIVIDEPTTGLHPADTEKLLAFFTELLAKDNTLIIIEHNLDIIAQADWIIDIGPGAGKFGGNIVFNGTVEQLLKDKKSATAKYLRQHLFNNNL